MGLGVIMSLNPSMIISIIGCIVGISGIVLGVMRHITSNKQLKESTRANDLKEIELDMRNNIERQHDKKDPEEKAGGS